MFRFTIRDVLWLMVAVGLCVGWFSESRAWERQRDVLLKRSDDLDEIQKMLGGDKALKDFVDSARSSNAKPPRPSSTIVPIKPKPTDRLKRTPQIRPQNEV